MPMSLEVRDGHAWMHNEDWGSVINSGDPLPCCGCKLSFSKGAQICDDCECHDRYRMFYLLPPRTT